MTLFPELNRRPLEDLMNRFIDPRHEKDVPEGEGELWLQEVAVQIARAGTKGIKFLLALMPEVDEQRLRAILIALPFAGREMSTRLRTECCSRARNLLGDPRPQIVAEAVDALWQLECREAEPQVFPLLDHPSPYVVGSVLRFAAHLFPRRAVALLERALDDANPIVRQNAIDELDYLESVQSLPKIKRLVHDADKDVRLAALTAVSNLEDMEERDQKASG